MGKMGRFTGHTLAVPLAALEWTGNGCTLGFECAAWEHLQSYVGLVERLPADFGGSEAGVGRALDQLRRVVRDFGSPALLRQLLRDLPQAVNGEAAPEMAHAALVWWVRGMEAAAGMVASILRALPTQGGDGGPQREQLQLLGGVAHKARRRIAPLIDALAAIKAPLLDANLGVSEACRQAGDLLQYAQEQVGGLHQRVNRQERQIAKLGLFGAHRKQDLVSQLHLMQKERAEALARSSGFLEQLGTLDALLDEGAWLEPALDGAIASLERLRMAWTRFGSGMTQLAADTAPALLADAAWADHALERVEAVRQWTALERASRRFEVDALIDFVGAPKPGRPS